MRKVFQERFFGHAAHIWGILHTFFLNKDFWRLEQRARARASLVLHVRPEFIAKKIHTIAENLSERRSMVM
jgi:hypothetical protein